MMKINIHKTSVKQAAFLMVHRYGKNAQRECSNRADRTENLERHEFWLSVQEQIALDQEGK